MDDKVTVSEIMLASANDKPNTLSNWFAENVLNPAVNAGPLAIYNTAAQFTDLPEYRLPVKQVDPYSGEWFVQGISSGVGAAVPMMLAAAGTGAAMRGANRLMAGTAAGNFLAPVLMSEKAAAIAGASMFGALQKPEDGHTRLGNAIGMGLGFLVFSGGNSLAKDATFARKALVYPLTGFAGGAVMTEASSLFSTGQLAPTDRVLQSAVQGMAMNTVMPVVTDYLSQGSRKGPAPEPQDKAKAQAARPLEQALAETTDAKAQRVTGPAAESVRPDNLAQISREYSAWVKENKPQYPSPEQFAKLKPEQIKALGFEHPSFRNLDYLDVMEALAGKKPRPLPDPKVVASEVRKSLSDMPLAKGDGPITVGQWNMEFLDAGKAKYFAETYKEVVPRHHLLAVQEVDAAGLAQIARDTGYKHAISVANTRGQAVGFLVNPRLKVLGETSYDNVANVKGIPDLRPAFRLDLQDTVTGEKMSAVVVHLKSMRGGPEATSPIRTEQARQMAKVLEPNFKGILTGDWNTFLEKSRDLDPLKNAGFKLLNPGDTTPTQAMNSRLDGFFYKGLSVEPPNPVVRPFFKNPLITRGLSDHALLSTQVELK